MTASIAAPGTACYPAPVKEWRLKGCIIRVGTGLLDHAGPELQPLPEGARRILLVTDTNVLPLAQRVAASLKPSGFEPLVHVLPPGETVKTLDGARGLYETLLSLRFERTDVVAAVGGGVVGDLAGFAASTYLRGLPFVQIPTTLLAQADAAIGGKTGVDFGGFKNLIGTFTQPRMVLIDPALLRTLPDREFRSGLAEIVKCGLIRDDALFELLERESARLASRPPDLLEDLVSRAVSVKVGIVESDERESGPRALLNFGHTIGHAVESAGAFDRWSHGEAVAIGMAAETEAAVRMGLCSPSVRDRLSALLERCGLPVRASGLDAARIREALTADKKNRDRSPRFALPEAIGRARWGIDVPSVLLDEILFSVRR